jgi:ribosome modulation factor
MQKRFAGKTAVITGGRQWTCPYQTGHSAWLDNWLAMNSRGERMRKPECGWMLL